MIGDHTAVYLEFTWPVSGLIDWGLNQSLNAGSWLKMKISSVSRVSLANVYNCP